MNPPLSNYTGVPADKNGNIVNKSIAAIEMMLITIQIFCVAVLRFRFAMSVNYV